MIASASSPRVAGTPPTSQGRSALAASQSPQHQTNQQTTKAIQTPQKLQTTTITQSQPSNSATAQTVSQGEEIYEQFQKMTHAEIQQRLHQKVNTFLASRGLYKAIVRNIPAVLSRDDFFLGLNCTLPINQWYFVPGGSMSPATVTLLAYASASNSLNSSQPIGNPGNKQGNQTVGLMGTQEYSVAYFGFDQRSIMQQFISKYNNFPAVVDSRRYYLHVAQALNQSMPVAGISKKDHSPSKNSSVVSTTNSQSKIIPVDLPIEETEDFKFFVQNELNKEIERLLPLDQQIQQQKEADALDLLVAKSHELGMPLEDLQKLNEAQVDIDQHHASDAMYSEDKRYRRFDDSVRHAPKEKEPIAPLVAAINEVNASNQAKQKKNKKEKKEKKKQDKGSSKPGKEDQNEFVPKDHHQQMQKQKGNNQQQAQKQGKHNNDQSHNKSGSQAKKEEFYKQMPLPDDNKKFDYGASEPAKGRLQYASSAVNNQNGQNPNERNDQPKASGQQVNAPSQDKGNNYPSSNSKGQPNDNTSQSQESQSQSGNPKNNQQHTGKPQQQKDQHGKQNKNKNPSASDNQNPQAQHPNQRQDQYQNVMHDHPNSQSQQQRQKHNGPQTRQPNQQAGAPNTTYPPVPQGNGQQQSNQKSFNQNQGQPDNQKNFNYQQNRNQANQPQNNNWKGQQNQQWYQQQPQNQGKNAYYPQHQGQQQQNQKPGRQQQQQQQRPNYNNQAQQFDQDAYYQNQGQNQGQNPRHQNYQNPNDQQHFNQQFSDNQGNQGYDEQMYSEHQYSQKSGVGGGQHNQDFNYSQKHGGGQNNQQSSSYYNQQQQRQQQYGGKPQNPNYQAQSSQQQQYQEQEFYGDSNYNGGYQQNQSNSFSVNSTDFSPNANNQTLQPQHQQYSQEYYKNNQSAGYSQPQSSSAPFQPNSTYSAPKQQPASQISVDALPFSAPNETHQQQNQPNSQLSLSSQQYVPPQQQQPESFQNEQDYDRQYY